MGDGPAWPKASQLLWHFASYTASESSGRELSDCLRENRFPDGQPSVTTVEVRRATDDCGRVTRVNARSSAAHDILSAPEQ